jgi:hypothetical protein
MKPVDMKLCVYVGSEQMIECGRVEGWGRESISFSEGAEIPVRLTQSDFTRRCFKMLYARALKYTETGSSDNVPPPSA